jgi:hypothetical protein
VVFGRRKNADVEITDADVEGFVDDLTPEERAQEDADIARELAYEEAMARGSVAAPQGPWDDSDAPVAERIDLGALQVAVTPEVEVRLEVSPEGQVVAVTLVHGESAAQLNVFAAPRSEGIWGEVLEEIAESLNSNGGSATEVAGEFGRELTARVPEQQPDGSVLQRPARFLGVDGPRWFLRMLLTGPAATQEQDAAPLIAAFRQVVVVRGTDPMPAREGLALSLPPNVPPPPGLPTGEPEPDGPPTLSLPERGPEITEIR